MNEQTTVTYSIAEILKRIEDKLDEQSEKIGSIDVKIATLTEKIEGMDKRLEKVEATQQNQIWALIVLLAGAVVTAGWRVFFTLNP